MFIEEADVLLADVVEVAQAEAEEVAEAFAFESSDPSFGECVCVGRKQWSFQAADIGTVSTATTFGSA